MEQIEELEEELANETLSELQDYSYAIGGDLSEEDLDELKRKHRNEEERQLAKADLKYLKALFGRLEQEKREAASETSPSNPQTTGATPITVSAPVGSQPNVETPDLDTGHTVDIAL